LAYGKSNAKIKHTTSSRGERMTITLNGTGTITGANTLTNTNTVTSATATALTLQSAGTTAITVDTSQNTTFAGSVKPLSTSGIIGTTTNNDASVGSVGEYVSSSVGNTTVTLTTGVTANLTSISLTAGDWDVQGNVGFDTASTANLTYWYAGVTTVSATLQNGYYQAANMVAPTGGAVFGTNAFSLPSPVARISLSATTTVYLITNVGFTVAAVKAGGMIKARRIR
jgi:hypothetical protein